MDLNWIEDFIVLSETENFSRAAEVCNVSQPAFSRRVRALEHWIGTPLFDRATHRVSLTEAGRRFLPSAIEIMRHSRNGRDAAREAGEMQAGLLRFTTTHSLSFGFFPEWLLSLGPAATSYNIQLRTSTIAVCEQMLLDGQAHFGLCHSHPAIPPRPNPSRYSTKLVGTDTLVLAAGRGLVEQGSAALAAAPQLAYNEESRLGLILNATGAWTRAVERYSPVFATHLVAVLRSMVGNDRGIAWLPLSLIKDDIRDNRITILSAPAEAIPIDIELFRQRTRQSASAEAFWALARDLGAPSAADSQLAS